MNLLSMGIILKLVDNLTANISKPIQEVNKLNNTVKNFNSNGFVAGIKKIQDAVKKATEDVSRLTQAADKFKNFGSSMMIKGAANAMILSAPVFDAANFEKAMAEVSTLTGMGVEEFKNKYSGEVLKLSQELGQSPEIIVKSMYQGLSAGLKLEEVFTFIKQAGKAGIAGVSDTFTAVDLGTTIKNAFNVDDKDMGKVFDVIFKTVKEGKTTFNEIANSFAEVGSVAASAGVSFEQVQAAVARLTLEGNKTGSAYTQIKYALESLSAPTNQAKKAFKALGVEINAKTLKENDILGTLDILAEKLKGLDEVTQAEMISQIFGSMEAQSFVKSFLMNRDAYKSMAEGMLNSQGVAEDAFSKMSKTTTQRLNELKSAFSSLKIGIGNTLLPALADLANGIMKVIKPIIEFANKHQTLVKYIIGGMAAFSGMAVVLGMVSFGIGIVIKTYANLVMGIKILSSVSQFFISTLRVSIVWVWQKVAAMGAWIARTYTATGGIARLGATLLGNFLRGITLATSGIIKMGVAFLATPIGWIVAGIAAVAGAAYLIYKNWDKVSAFFSRLWSGIKNIFTGAFSSIKNNFTGFFSQILKVIAGFNPVALLIKNIKSSLNGLSSVFKNFNPLEAIKSIITQGIGLGRDIVGGIAKGILSGLFMPFEAIKKVGSGIIGGFKSLLGIKSPSKVFYQDGLNIIAGLNSGIKNGKVADVPAPEIGKGILGMNAIKSIVSLKAPIPAKQENKSFNLKTQAVKPEYNINASFNFTVNGNMTEQQASNLKIDFEKKIIEVLQKFENKKFRTAF